MAYLLFHVSDIAQLIKKMQDNKFDAIIVVDGRRGLGKSTFAYKLALKIGGFKPKKDICFTREDVCRKLATQTKKVIFADEMINVTYNRDFYAEEQKQLIKMLNMYRDSCNVLIACVPNFYDLDKQFRALVKIRVNVVRRGFAILHTQNKSSYSTDVWQMALNEKIEKTWQSKRVKNPQYSRLTTYRGVIRYGDLSPASREKYEKIKQSKRNVVFNYGVNDEDTKKKTIYKNVAQLFVDGKMNEEGLMQVAMVNDIDYKKFKGRLNIELKNVGEKKPLRILLKERQQKDKIEKVKRKAVLNVNDLM